MSEEFKTRDPNWDYEMVRAKKRKIPIEKQPGYKEGYAAGLAAGEVARGELLEALREISDVPLTKAQMRAVARYHLLQKHGEKD